MNGNTIGFLIFIGNGIYCAFLVGRFNLRIFKAGRNVEQAYKEEGIQWSFRSIENRYTLAFFPDNLILASDSEYVREAKHELVKVAKTKWPTLFWCWGSMFLTFVLMFLIGSLLRHYFS